MRAAHFFTQVSQTIEDLNVSAELKTVETELRKLEGKGWRAARLEAD